MKRSNPCLFIVDDGNKKVNPLLSLSLFLVSGGWLWCRGDSTRENRRRISSQGGWGRGRGVDRLSNWKRPKALQILLSEVIQMCYHHELHLILPEGGDDDELVKDLVHADLVEKTAKSIVPDGIRVGVPLRRVFTPED